MPIYLYECNACGVRFEKMQRMSEAPLTRCPECEGQVHRVIQPVGDDNFTHVVMPMHIGR